MKYELVKTDTKQFAGKTMYRIRALVAIGLSVSIGDLGGYIESEKNLSQVSGDAWVSGDAQVYGDAWVSGNARVYGNAWVSGNAQVYGDAWVSGNARVYGDAWVSGNARVYGNAQVSSHKTWLLIGPAKSSGRFTTAFVDDKIGVRVVCGCFTGTVEQFSEQIEKTHKNNQENLEQYRLFCQLISFTFGLQQAQRAQLPESPM
jgi:hypothetical protein